MKNNINGILLLNKPLDISSNHALQKVKRLFNAKKAGHTGSLDPLATGMLPICFGEATKFSQFLLDSDKVYRVQAKLGETTNTGDTEGEVTKVASCEHVTDQAIADVLAGIRGVIEQVPPMFSAIKKNGKPLYELARRGIEVERKARKITIHNLTLHAYTDAIVDFTVHCSKGTYVRTLVEDIGEKLGCGAHVVGLHRDAVSPYQGHAMYDFAMLEAIKEEQGELALTKLILPVETSVEVLPAVQLSTSAAFYLQNGQAVRANLPLGASLVRLMSQDSRFIGIGEVLADGRVKPHRLLAS